MTPDEIAYQVVQEAKLAAQQGNKKPDRCPEDLWEVLKEKYAGKNTSLPELK